MVIAKGVIFNVCKKIIRNNIIVFIINFIQEYVSEISDSDDVTISKGTTEVTLKDSSKHLLPNVNICVMGIPNKRKIRKGNLENERSDFAKINYSMSGKSFLHKPIHDTPLL